jgi:hypothetical protein
MQQLERRVAFRRAMKKVIQNAQKGQVQKVLKFLSLDVLVALRWQELNGILEGRVPLTYAKSKNRLRFC